MSALAASENKKREQKVRKKDPKSWPNVSKSLENLEGPEVLGAFEAKYNELYNDYRALQIHCQNLTAQFQSTVKEKEHLTNDLAKSLDIRTRLETVARELQKQNKEVKDDYIVKLKAEEERRKEVTTQFQKTLTEINDMMISNRETNEKLRRDNEDMTNKINQLSLQFHEREDDIQKLNHQINLEKQLAEATLAKAKFEYHSEKVIWDKQREVLEEKWKKSQEQREILQETVSKLEENINMYKTQYDTFEGTISKSTEMFNSCKTQMSKLNKRISELEAESLSWKKQFEKAAQSIIDLTSDKHKQEQEVQNFNRRLQQLKKLCRQLQLDRASYIKLLKAHGIEPTSETLVQDPPEKTEDLTKKEIELKQLQNELMKMQSQLSAVVKCTNVDDGPNKNEISDLNGGAKDMNGTKNINGAKDLNGDAKDLEGVAKDLDDIANDLDNATTSNDCVENNTPDDQIAGQENPENGFSNNPATD